MGNIVPNIIICAIIFGSLGSIYLVTKCWWIALGGEGTNYTLTQLIDQHQIEYGWILKLLMNTFGYSCVFLPGLLIYQYTKKTKYLERSEDGVIHSCVKYCYAENEIDRPNEFTINKTNAPATNSIFKDCIMVTYCFVGLMASYLTWGLLQEKIMTQHYESVDGKRMYFKDSQFLVFANRALAFTISGIYLFLKQYTRRHRAPIYKYSFASVSNIFSAWFQYEALKFVSFPTQVLAKSCKIIPVMLMGKIISRSKYEFYEYLTAILISIGMICFLSGSANGVHASSITTMTGVLLLVLYMTFDSFTSNWQGDLFRVYSVSSMQMMCGVNFFSTLLTASSLFLQGGFMDSVDFASAHPKFVVDCVILSLSSAIGQLFIFYTIYAFGPVVFTIIMTVRQCVAILLSCLVYKHEISAIGIFGVFIVFLAIFLRVYCNQRLKSIRRRSELNNTRIGV